jgi:uncharacterized RDD family membrane protein YckC
VSEFYETYNLERAPIKKRVFAALIDAFFIPSFVGVVINVLFVLASPQIGRLVSLLFLLVWFSTKDLLFEGAAPGKQMMGLRVVSRLTQKKITLSQCFLRNILFILPLIAFFSFPIEFFRVILKKERFGDLWANTAVVSQE